MGNHGSGDRAGGVWQPQLTFQEGWLHALGQETNTLERHLSS
jgi:hypothetical protein